MRGHSVKAHIWSRHFKWNTKEPRVMVKCLIMNCVNLSENYNKSSSVMVFPKQPCYRESVFVYCNGRAIQLTKWHGNYLELHPFIWFGQRKSMTDRGNVMKRSKLASYCIGPEVWPSFTSLYSIIRLTLYILHSVHIVSESLVACAPHRRRWARVALNVIERY